jgi:pimeloyl-ACP methyl ester carboxylesterase
MKKITVVLLLAVAGYWAATSPTAGRWIYAAATTVEASVYGLEQRTVDIGELPMVTYVSGIEQKQKPAILMIHGFSADRDVWPRFAKHFVEDYRLVIPDLAGHGDTGYDPKWDYSAPAQAKRLAALLEALDIQQAHVIGNSMGGFITAWFARMYPERTLTAAPMDPAGLDFPVLSDMHKMIEAQGKNPFFVHNRADFDLFYGMTMEQPPFLPESVLAAQAQDYQQRREELVLIENGFYHHDWLTDELQYIETPSLVMWGEADRILHVSAAPLWQQKLPNSQLHIFEGIGHMPMVEVPAEAAAVYRQFIEAY